VEVKKTDKFEVHYVFDIPNIVLSVVNILLKRKDNKAYIFIFGNPENLPKMPTEIAECIK
jgi:hypothetical protein